MLAQDLQQTQTIEFLKTRLMERDREILDFETKSKKIQLKHTRDLKEAKIAQERAKNLLKEEKNKADKYLKQLKESQEQITQLNLRVGDLIKEKEREVSQLKGLYNSMKEEVRKYERILPTLTFLNEFGLTIESIPPYQDIFINLKDKIVQLQQTIHNFQTYKSKSEETIKMVKQNEEAMRVKKLQIQKNLNEIISKLEELQYHNSQLRIVQNELRQKNEELQRLYLGESQRNAQLQRSHKQFEQKISELQIFYANEIENKEDEIRKIAQNQFSKFQQEIQSLQGKSQMKESMYLQQIRILEDQVYFLQAKISEEKANFQDNYIEIKMQIQKMREEVDQERQAHEQLKERYEQIVRSLIKVGRHNDQLQLKVQQQQRKIQMYEQKQRKILSTASDIQISQIKHMQQSYDQLLQKYTQANNIINALRQANSYLQEEAATLRSQIVSKKTPEFSHTLQLPPSFLDFQNFIKKSSTQDQSTHNSKNLVQTVPIVSNNHNNEEKQLQMLRKESQDKQLKDKIYRLQNDISVLRQKTKKLQDQLLQRIVANEKMSKDIVNLKKQRDRYFQQTIKLKQKNTQLSSSLSQKHKEVAFINANSNILKEKVQFLSKKQESSNELIKNEIALQNTLKEEIKQLKELGLEENNHIKKIKELNYQLQLTKRQTDKMRSQGLLKENSLASEIRQLKKIIEEQTKTNDKVAKFNADLTQLKNENAILQTKLIGSQDEKSTLSKLVEELKQQIQKKQREIAKLTQSLARERKERSLLSVPSLKVLDQKIYEQEKQKSQALSLDFKLKDQKIHDLERQIQDLKEQIENIKLAETARLQAIQTQQNYYIQEIIQMKMKCAESEMKAAECQHLYNLLKRKSSKSTL